MKRTMRELLKKWQCKDEKEYKLIQEILLKIYYDIALIQEMFRKLTGISIKVKFNIDLSKKYPREKIIENIEQKINNEKRMKDFPIRINQDELPAHLKIDESEVIEMLEKISGEMGL